MLDNSDAPHFSRVAANARACTLPIHTYILYRYIRDTQKSRDGMADSIRVVGEPSFRGYVITWMTAMLLKIESLYIGYRADFIDRFRPT